MAINTPTNRESGPITLSPSDWQRARMRCLRAHELEARAYRILDYNPYTGKPGKFLDEL